MGYSQSNQKGMTETRALEAGVF